MNLYLSGLLWVAGAAAVGGLTAYLVRRFGLDEGRPDNNDAAGQVFTIISGLHAVLMAFVLISLFDGANAVEEGSYAEADSLVAATWAAESLPADVGARMRELSAAYAGTVAEQEWPQMRAGDEVTSPGWDQLNELRAVVAGAEVTDDWQESRKEEATDQLWQLYQEREARLTGVHGELNAVLWFALILGGVISTLLPNLFGGTKLLTHVIIVSTLAGTITLLLFAIYQLQNPFAGGAAVDPDAFTAAAERLR
ncbi:DUF4239 domain-containing protein [Amycolatopsis nigrescens]|uniref:bestrophin-like domain n=1 Tax=Amycolatopsis nigrescens TaxID=381445 RepID=UPI000361C604|nr:DUF4239 domain-containing protein [Amycolatopsis nigrescens]